MQEQKNNGRSSYRVREQKHGKKNLAKTAGKQKCRRSRRCI